MHLRYCCAAACIDCKENRHPQIVMKSLGITYQLATPQSMADQWWFWNCENIPDVLPKFLKELCMNPSDAVGFGLREIDAQNIIQSSEN